jgi:3-hydroxybutyryl-CoA dehydrogenase
MKYDQITKIAVVGAGLMGHGIALEFALHGYDVKLNDVSEETLRLAIENVRANLALLESVGVVPRGRVDAVISKIATHTELRETVKNADIVIEAVFESLDLKREVFRDLDHFCPAQTILASNSSTLMPGNLAEVTERPDKVLVTHYFNPPFLLPLVEVVRHQNTSDETVSTVVQLLERVGKRPVVLQKEVPGFIGNRLQMALFREALYLVEQGVASPEDVDTVVKTGFGRRYAAAGPFEIWGLAGWDLIEAVAKNLLPDLASSSEVSNLLAERVSCGELGAKSAQGFYHWTPESIAALKNLIGRGLIAISQEVDDGSEP